MISWPNFEKPPVLISLLEACDCWLDLGGADVYSGAFAWLLALLWLAATAGAGPVLLATDGGLEAATDAGLETWLAWLRGIAGAACAASAGLWLLVLITGCSDRLEAAA